MRACPRTVSDPDPWCGRGIWADETTPRVFRGINPKWTAQVVEKQAAVEEVLPWFESREQVTFAPCEASEGVAAKREAPQRVAARHAAIEGSTFQAPLLHVHESRPPSLQAGVEIISQPWLAVV